MSLSNEPRIEQQPHVCHGKPVIRGTRVLVSVLIDAVRGGDTIEQVADDYRVSVDDVRAAIVFHSQSNPE